MTGQLERPSPDVFLSVCSNKLVKQAMLSSETLTLLGNGCHGERALHLPCLSLEVKCCRLFGDLYSNLIHVLCYLQ